MLIRGAGNSRGTYHGSFESEPEAIDKNPSRMSIAGSDQQPLAREFVKVNARAHR
jgi:hypothetical protein